MQSLQRIHAIISEAVNELNVLRPAERRLQTTADAPLYDASGMLDSLELVNLIVAVEEKLESAFGVTLTLADEQAVSQVHSPFRSIEAFASYVAMRLEQRGV
jgi:acyl carrier protein